MLNCNNMSQYYYFLSNKCSLEEQKETSFKNIKSYWTLSQVLCNVLLGKKDMKVYIPEQQGRCGWNPTLGSDEALIGEDTSFWAELTQSFLSGHLEMEKIQTITLTRIQFNLNRKVRFRSTNVDSTHSHFLSNGGIFLEKQINIYVKVACRYTPGHSSNHLKYKQRL